MPCGRSVIFVVCCLSLIVVGSPSRSESSSIPTNALPVESEETQLEQPTRALNVDDSPRTSVEVAMDHVVVAVREPSPSLEAFLERAKMLQDKLDDISMELSARLSAEHFTSQSIRRRLQERRDSLLRNTPNFWGVAMRRLRHYMLYVTPLEHQHALASAGAAVYYDVPKGREWRLQPVDDEGILRELLTSVTCFKTHLHEDGHSSADDTYYNITMLFDNNANSYPFAVRHLNKIVPVSLSHRHQGEHDGHRTLGRGTELDFSRDFLFSFDHHEVEIVPVPGSFFSLFLAEDALARMRDGHWVLQQAKLHAFVRDVCVELMHNPIALYDRGILEDQEEAAQAEMEAEALAFLVGDL
jgi:hypothetical protein